MARGTILSTLRSMCRAEVGQTASTSIATQGDASMNILFSNKQKLLSGLRDWPFLRHRWEVACAAGDRYLDFPTTDVRSIVASINTERPFQAYTKFNNRWLPLDYGIDVDEFNVRIEGTVQDPIMRWEWSTNIGETGANPDEFEIWPLPATAQTLRFTGQRNVRTLASDSDKADLDDMLLVYMVATELLQRIESPEAQVKANLATQRLNFLTSAYQNRTEKVTLGRNLIPRRGERRFMPIITTAP